MVRPISATRAVRSVMIAAQGEPGQPRPAGTPGPQLRRSVILDRSPEEADLDHFERSSASPRSRSALWMWTVTSTIAARRSRHARSDRFLAQVLVRSALT